MGGIDDLSGGDCMYRFGSVMLTEIIPQLIAHSKTNFQEYMLIGVFHRLPDELPTAMSRLPRQSPQMSVVAAKPTTVSPQRLAVLAVDLLQSDLCLSQQEVLYNLQWKARKLS
jgi:hypothetical protein